MNAAREAAMELELTSKLKLLLSLIAMMGCLMAASQLHAHEPGLHDVNHTCISCDLEDVLSHGAVPASTLSLKTGLQDSEPAACLISAYTTLCSFRSIRAPPLHS